MRTKCRVCGVIFDQEEADAAAWKLKAHGIEGAETCCMDCAVTLINAHYETESTEQEALNQ